MEGGFGGFDGRGGGKNRRWEGRKFFAEWCEAEFQGLGRGTELGIAHALDEWLRWNIKGVVAGEVGLPFRGEFQEFFRRLTLKGLFDFIDARDRRANASHFALVLTADDFL
jgi:hypothetical protein